MFGVKEFTHEFCEETSRVKYWSKSTHLLLLQQCPSNWQRRSHTSLRLYEYDCLPTDTLPSSLSWFQVTNKGDLKPFHVQSSPILFKVPTVAPSFCPILSSEKSFLFPENSTSLKESFKFLAGNDEGSLLPMAFSQLLYKGVYIISILNLSSHWQQQQLQWWLVFLKQLFLLTLCFTIHLSHLIDDQFYWFTNT